MIAILAFLTVVIVIAAQKKESPKAVIQSWFSRSVSTGDNTTTVSDSTILTGTMTGNLDGSTTGSLTDDDKKQTEDLMNSLIQQP